MQTEENYYGQNRVCSLTPTEFEKHCLIILNGYAEEEKLPNFSIEHNVKLTASDGTYQIDVYATYTALGAEMKIICECKQYKNRVNRDKVMILDKKIQSLGAQKGILMSTAGFQSGAIQYAHEHGIALIQVFDTRENWYSHSGGPDEVIDEDDPIVYGEKHMPRYQARLITADQTETIYPTRAMVNEVYKAMNELSLRKHGVKMFENLDDGERT